MEKGENRKAKIRREKRLSKKRMKGLFHPCITSEKNTEIGGGENPNAPKQT